jgi:hypothetical protein
VAVTKDPLVVNVSKTKKNKKTPDVMNHSDGQALFQSNIGNNDYHRKHKRKRKHNEPQ